MPEPRQKTAVGLGSALIVPPTLVSENGVQKKADRPPERSAAAMDARHQEVLDAMPMTAQCAFCPWTFEGPAAVARERARAHREAEHPAAVKGARRQGSSGWKRREATPDLLAESEGRRAIHERAAQREALGRMDAGEPQKPQRQPEASEPARRPSPRRKWTRETGIAAIRAYAAEHGHPPGSNALRGLSIACSQRPDMPPWADLVEAAGFPKPTLGTRYRKPLSAGEPSETRRPFATPPSRGPDAPDAGPSPAPSGPGGKPRSLLDLLTAQPREELAAMLDAVVAQQRLAEQAVDRWRAEARLLEEALKQVGART